MTALPTKKQKQILDFITTFTTGNGYGPSYREVMKGLGYKSVSTVAVHIDGLIAKGYLKKGEGYAVRSLIVTTPSTPQAESAGLRYVRELEAKLSENGETAEAQVLQEAIKIIEANQQKSKSDEARD